MPIHNFYCGNCQKILEALIPLKDTDKKVKCPYCKKNLKKLMSAPKTIKIN